MKSLARMLLRKNNFSEKHLDFLGIFLYLKKSENSHKILLGLEEF